MGRWGHGLASGRVGRMGRVGVGVVLVGLCDGWRMMGMWVCPVGWLERGDARI